MTQEAGLFVAEDEDMGVGSDSENAVKSEQPQESRHPIQNPLDSDLDPIIESLPLILASLPNRDYQSLHILQYPGRPTLRSLDTGVLLAQVKPQSRYLEVKSPLDTSKFFDASKSDKWGDTIDIQQVAGVLNQLEGSLYAGHVVKSEEEPGVTRIHLIPVDSTSQLRPAFKYIDAADNALYAQNRVEHNEQKKPSNVQILQTSAKLGRQITNHEASALGDALRSIKKFDEEKWRQLQWQSADLEKSKELRSTLESDSNTSQIKTSTTMAGYIDSLVADLMKC